MIPKRLVGTAEPRNRDTLEHSSSSLSYTMQAAGSRMMTINHSVGRGEPPSKVMP